MSFAEQLAARAAATKKRPAAPLPPSSTPSAVLSPPPPLPVGGGRADEVDDENAAHDEPPKRPSSMPSGTRAGGGATATRPRHGGSPSAATTTSTKKDGGATTTQTSSFASAIMARTPLTPPSGASRSGKKKPPMTPAGGDDDDGTPRLIPHHTAAESVDYGDDKQQEQQQKQQRRTDDGGRDRRGEEAARDRLDSENRRLRRESLLLGARLSGLDLSGDSGGGRGGGGRGEDGLLDVSGKSGLSSELSRDELSRENIRLTQILVDNDELDVSKKDATIAQLQQKLAQTESELVEVTELKNAEIEVLRKQLNRAEHSRTTSVAKDAKEEDREKRWSKEREGFREEIRRLNLEISSLKEKCQRRESVLPEEEEEELGLTRRYGNSNGGGGANLAPQYSSAQEQLDSSDVASLQSIIAMMRQTIDQSDREKDLLERRLSAEQERSQMELKAFGRTLEGVDDLRRSAEAMGREIRRIRVRGYRPTRSDLLGGGVGRGIVDGGARDFGELTAAVEASDNMEEAIRLIESQNDAMEERRRMGVVASRAAASAAEDGAASSRGALGTSSDLDREGGFLSFWNNSGAGAGCQDSEKEESGGNNNGGAGKGRKKKSKRKHKKRGDGGGSVLTSFF